jgi:aspartyl/asparaginyl-tRNA synthetase
MGLGSDSDPVCIKLNGLNTHLADSQQFVLEYALRLQHSPGVKGEGVYYIRPSCKGEDTDAMHLNQLCHFESELPVVLDDGLVVAERWVVRLTRALLDSHAEEIQPSVGTTEHVKAF